MPGLVGIIGRSEPGRNRADLLAMWKTLQHEPFYSSGTYIDEERGIYLGWTCHKDSYCDCMPVLDENNGRFLVFYGENHSNLYEYLGSDSDGARGKAGTDLRALLDLYGRDRDNFVKILNGWFHGVLVDMQRREMLLFNDRYGVQRLYYHEDRDAFLFSAEAKAILKVRRELRQIDSQSLGEFLACDAVLENRSLFRKIYLLPGGSLWRFKEGEVSPTRHCYFKPQEWEEQPTQSTKDVYEQMEYQLPSIMARYLEGGPKVGVSLTAGLDSRLIMASLGSQHEKVSCYSFDGMYRESFDSKLARQVATACNRDHTRLILERDYLTAFPELAERTIYLSDGCLNAGSAYELYLNKLARQIAVVRVTGSYGSEVFRGLRGFKAVPQVEKITHPDLQVHVNQAVHTYERISKCSNLTFGIFRQAPWYGYGRIAVEQSQVALRTPYMDNDLVQLLYKAPETVRSNSQLQWHLIERGNAALINIPTDRGLYRNSGPLLSRLAYLKSYSLFKADYYYKSGMPNWLEQIHYFLGPLRPENLIVGRHRFYHNRIWFRLELASYLKAILLDPVTLGRSYLNGSVLEAMVLSHTKGDRNYTAELDKALTMELIHRLLVQG